MEVVEQVLWPPIFRLYVVTGNWQFLMVETCSNRLKQIVSNFIQTELVCDSCSPDNETTCCETMATRVIGSGSTSTEATKFFLQVVKIFHGST